MGSSVGPGRHSGDTRSFDPLGPLLGGDVGGRRPGVEHGCSCASGLLGSELHSEAELKVHKPCVESRWRPRIGEWWRDSRLSLGVLWHILIAKEF